MFYSALGCVGVVQMSRNTWYRLFELRPVKCLELLMRGDLCK